MTGLFHPGAGDRLTRRRRGGAPAVCAALALAVVAAAALAATETAAAGAPAAARKGGPGAGKGDAELSRLYDFLTGPDRTFATRRDAAAVLLEKETPAARTMLVEVLSRPAPSEATLATLEALALHDTADDALAAPVLALLRSDDDATRRAAAAAFAAFQGNEAALRGLRETAAAADAAAGIRLAAIQAMSQLIDKRSLDALVALTADPKPAVAAAASAALADMTGEPDMAGRDAWAAWWKVHKDEPDLSLLGGLVRRFREELRRQGAALERVQSRLLRQLTDAYEAADAKEKGRLALEQLEDAVPQVRALAARQAAAMARSAVAAGNAAARAPYQDLVAALLKHVNDESPLARAAAAEAVAAWQEPSAGPVLLARLDQENVPEVRAALAAALGGLKVVEAVPKLVAMLDASSEIEVVRAAGALGVVGDKNAPSPAPVAPAIKPLAQLARTAAAPAVREAACLALAKIAPPVAEEILVGALDDPTASVRFAAAQGLGSLGKGGVKTLAALAAHLQDENKGVRQAVAAALAKIDGPEAARKMADRLKAGAETEPAVRNALWDAVRLLVERSPAPDLAQELGDRFFGHEGAEEMQRAAAMYEAALAKIPAAARAAPQGLALTERLIDAYVAAGQPDGAVPALRQLIQATPPENKPRLRQLHQQLGLILLAKEPYTEAVAPVAAALAGADEAVRITLVRAILTRAEALLKADRPEPAMDLLAAFNAARPDWGDTPLGASLKPLMEQASAATAAQAAAKLAGSAEQVAAATATLKKVGRPAVGPLLAALETAARQKQAPQEGRLLAALQAVTGDKELTYSLQAPLEERLKKIEAWRRMP